jgi:S-DNA-T family DNA segregation ATPase FtsK/SpoIIIE
VTSRFERFRKSRRFGELVGLLLLLLAALTFMSLVSYDAQDSSWFQRRSNPEVRNWIGAIGANLSEALLQLLGAAAFLVPVILGFLGWSRFRGRGVAASYGPLIGHAVLLLSLASLLDLIYGGIAYGGAAFRAGGVLGSWTAGALAAVVNRPGALVVSLGLVAGAIVATTRFSFAHALAAIPGALTGGWSKLRERWTALREGRRREAQRKAVIRKHADRARSRPAATAGSSATSAQSAAEGPAAPPPSGPRSAASPRIMDGPPRPAPPKPPEPPRQQDLPMETSAAGYALPPLELLKPVETQRIDEEKDLLERARLLADKFREFSMDGTVVAIHPGPVVTTFEYKPEAGIKYSKITGFADDLCMALSAESVRIDRLPGRSTVGIEVPNVRQELIFPRELMESERFQDSKSRLSLALGKTISGEVFTADLKRMPHLLIAGATGAGKSVGLNGMIASILYKSTPAEVRFIMIDTKMIELGIYADIPHLLIPVVTDAKKASTALRWGVREMEIRYRQLAAVGVRNIDQFNDLLDEEPDRTAIDERTGEELKLRKLPYIVIVIDEMADLMMVSSADVEESVMRLAQMARAVGIHLILATQRPSVDVITGTIKANFPSRIAFRVSTRVDSRTIIDTSGAERLLGRGDMLFLPPGSARLVRLHGGYITEPELNRITAFLKKQAKPVYDESVLKESEEEPRSYDGGERDAMFMEAVRLVLSEGQCSITLIQRRLRLGYARAARIVDVMEQEGIVGPADGSKPREVLAGPEILETLES